MRRSARLCCRAGRSAPPSCAARWPRSTSCGETLPLVDQQLAARRELAAQGHFSRLRLLEYEQLRIEHVQNIDVQQSAADRARAAIANIDAEHRQRCASISPRKPRPSCPGAETEFGPARRGAAQVGAPARASADAGAGRRHRPAARRPHRRRRRPAGPAADGDRAGRRARSRSRRRSSTRISASSAKASRCGSSSRPSRSPIMAGSRAGSRRSAATRSRTSSSASSTTPASGLRRDTSRDRRAAPADRAGHGRAGGDQDRATPHHPISAVADLADGERGRPRTLARGRARPRPAALLACLPHFRRNPAASSCCHERVIDLASKPSDRVAPAPAAGEDKGEGKVAWIESRAGRVPRMKGRLLLVEDDPALTDLLKWHFEREDFDVEHTARRRGGAAARRGDRRPTSSCSTG